MKSAADHRGRFESPGHTAITVPFLECYRFDALAAAVHPLI